MLFNCVRPKIITFTKLGLILQHLRTHPELPPLPPQNNLYVFLTEQQARGLGDPLRRERRPRRVLLRQRRRHRQGHHHRVQRRQGDLLLPQGSQGGTRHLHVEGRSQVSSTCFILQCIRLRQCFLR